MTEYLAKVTSKGQITLPAAARRQLGIETGDSVRITVIEQTASLERNTHTVASVRGIIPALPGIETKDFDRLIEEAMSAHADEVIERMRQGLE